MAESLSLADAFASLLKRPYGDIFPAPLSEDDRQRFQPGGLWNPIRMTRAAYRRLGG